MQGEGVSFDRRSLLGMAAAATALPLGAAAAEPGDTKGECPRDVTGVAILRTPASAEAETVSGKVRGFARGDIAIFRGIPYGSKLDGAARFRPAGAPEAWAGVRSCLSYGPVCPQPPNDYSSDEANFIADRNDGYEREDCLTLNVWTGSLDRNARRPVMVWLHGGGFVSGSSYELPAYEGARLAERGMVVVGVTHRLGAFGFMDLAHLGGADYAQSGNVGMLDLELALRWVRDNIEGFGGDPSCVTICGQSGGGGKVSALMAMPSARGLFHRAIVMSGSFPPACPQGDAQHRTDAVMSKLGVKTIAELQAVSARRLVEAGQEALRELAAKGAPTMPGQSKGTMQLSGTWMPVADGITYPDLPWQDHAPEVSRDVPLMVGTVRDEFKRSTPEVDEAGLERQVNRIYGASAGAMLQALRRDFPTFNANELSGVVSGISWRLTALAQLDKKAAQGGAPAFGYWFLYAPPLLDGRLGVPHCADIAYAFDNCERCDQQTGNGSEANRIADVMAGAFVAFAKTGQPHLPGKDWAKHDRTVSTAVIDRNSAVIADPARDVFAVARMP